MKKFTAGQIVKLRKGKVRYIIVDVKKDKVFVKSESGLTEGYFVIPNVTLFICKQKKESPWRR